MIPDLKRFLTRLPARTMLWLLVVTALLTALHYGVDTLPEAQRLPLKSLSSLSVEGSLANMFAGFLWVISALSACTCFLTERFTISKPSRLWLVIAAVLAFAAIDETCGIHEQFAGLWNYLRSLSFQLPDWAGEPNMLWQTLYALPLTVFFVVATRLVWNRTHNLPQVRLAFVGAIACFVFAIGCECISDCPLVAGKFYEIPFFRYTRIIYSGEEVLEDVGTILMLFAFMKYATSLAVRNLMETTLTKTPPYLVSMKS